MTALCIVCPVHSRKPRAPQWGQACETCRDTMRSGLLELAEQYTLLDAQPSQSGGPKVSGTREAPLPGRLDVLNLVGPGAANVRDRHGDQHGELPPLVWMQQWARDWRDNGAPGDQLPPPALADTEEWLRHRLDWACDEHPAVDEFARELGQQVATLRAVNGERSDRITIGPCPTQFDDRTTCGAPLKASPWLTAITCRRCGVRYDREHWLWLGQVLRDTATEPGVA